MSELPKTVEEVLYQRGLPPVDEPVCNALLVHEDAAVRVQSLIDRVAEMEEVARVTAFSLLRGNETRDARIAVLEAENRALRKMIPKVRGGGITRDGRYCVTFKIARHHVFESATTQDAAIDAVLARLAEEKHEEAPDAT